MTQCHAMTLSRSSILYKIMVMTMTLPLFYLSRTMCSTLVSSTVRWLLVQVWYTLVYPDQAGLTLQNLIIMIIINTTADHGIVLLLLNTQCVVVEYDNVIVHTMRVYW